MPTLDERRALLAKFKSVPCADCKQTRDPSAMCFDHIKGDRLFSIGDQALRIHWDRVMAEIAKCEVVCMRCYFFRSKVRQILNKSPQGVEPELPRGRTAVERAIVEREADRWFRS